MDAQRRKRELDAVVETVDSELERSLTVDTENRERHLVVDTGMSGRKVVYLVVDSSARVRHLVVDNGKSESPDLYRSFPATTVPCC